MTHTSDGPDAAAISTAPIQAVSTNEGLDDATLRHDKKTEAMEAIEVVESEPTTAHTPIPPSQHSNVVLRWLQKLDYVPKNCRWDPEDPPHFGWGLCFLFALAGMFTVSNLYYNHPILNILAEEFDISYETASQVPTFMQAGYAVGITFICPMADMFRRRPLTLTLVFVTATIWLGLCLTNSFTAFRILSFFAAITTVTPQVMLPLVAELAPPKRRAMMISVNFVGLFTGLLFARILSGIATQYTSWRTIYFIALGIQYALLIVLFVFLPDYPSVNPEGITYFHSLYTMVKIALRQPLLIQTSFICFFISASYVGFWTTLTFQLAMPPFSLSTIDIGLFALMGIPPFIINPNLVHFLLKHVHAIWASVIGLSIALVGILIGTFVGTFSLAGPIVMGVLIDMGLILVQTACRTQLVPIEPHARNRVNTVFMLTCFCGMLMGTAVCNKLYAMGGWHYSGYIEIGFVVIAIGLCFVRGPHETHWFGYRGGWRIKSSLEVDGDEDEVNTTATATAADDSPENSSEGDEKPEQPVTSPSNMEKGMTEKSG
ncbi:hypothetical protein SBRCBS47491_007973 [Sporothrix bragantina]|uniref:Major facilitator superfamily (MFS) profile domain-containing protein n=1 Tax=Sporothrix bragantina TaxID=671064 RepID=A0ABP0CKF4_9PEZI